MRRTCVALAAALVTVSASTLAGTPARIGVDKCKPCHMSEFETWSASAHASALETAKVGEGFGPACVRCHGAGTVENTVGVDCEACHGPGSEYWPIPVMIDKEKAVAAGLLIQDQKLCDTCHDGQDHHAKVVFGKFKHDHREKKGVVDEEK